MVVCYCPGMSKSMSNNNTWEVCEKSVWDEDTFVSYFPPVEEDPREKLILSLKREIKVLRNENHYLRQQLEFPAKPKGPLQKENDEKFVKFLKDQNLKEKQNGAKETKDESGLYEMLQEYMVENESLRTENADWQSRRDKFRQEQQILSRDNERLQKRIDDLERSLVTAKNSYQQMPRQNSYPDPARLSNDRSPRGSPNYTRAGRLPPPQDLPLRDPPLQYPTSPPQGYTSPSNSSKGKPLPLANRGQPLKPPHRLPEPIRSPLEQNGGIPNGVPGGYNSAHYRPTQNSPHRQENLSRRSSQSSNSDAIRDMNEKLKQELLHLEGEIHQQHRLNSRTRDVYGSSGSIR